MIPIKSTGKCTTTHNACDCVLRELEALRKIKDAAKAICEETGYYDGPAGMCDLVSALADYERGEVKE